MIKLNIQLFGGDDGKDRSEAADYNSSGTVDVPGIDGVIYTVPASLFSKIDAAMFEGSNEEIREAKVIMSYYLTYNRYPPTNDVAEAHAEAIGLDGGNINVNPNSDAYRRYMIPDLQTEIDKGNVTDPLGNRMGVTRREQAEGYTTSYGMPVGRTKQGVYVYKDPESGSYFAGSDSNPITNFTQITDLNGNAVSLNPKTNELINSATGEAIQPAPRDGAVSAAPIDTAFNQYYNELFSQRNGTLGKQILDNNINLYEQEAQNARTLANTSMQAQAMTQAQGVKQVTDSIRAERMAQLRAGMSESQLADRELQMLMGSVNQFGAQAQMANQEATAANLASTTAREQAFNDYIAQATALGQNAAANYASQAGDLVAAAQAYQQRAAAEGKVISITDALNFVSGNTNNPAS